MEEEPPFAIPLWETVGRGTAAGRALFAIYGGDLGGRKAGNRFSDHNLQMLRKSGRSWRPTRLWGRAETADPTRVKRPEVKVPRYGRHTEPPLSAIEKLKGRKTAKAIQEDLEREFEREGLPVPPHPKGAVLDDKEKYRFQRLLEWEGRPPEEDEELIESFFRKADLKTSAKDQCTEMQNLFHSLMTEVEEREEFLAYMRRLGRGHVYEGKITAEIDERVKAMRKLDEHLRGQH